METPAGALLSLCGGPSPLATVGRVVRCRVLETENLTAHGPVGGLALVGRVRLRCSGIPEPWLCPATSQPARQDRTPDTLPSAGIPGEGSVRGYPSANAGGRVGRPLRSQHGKTPGFLSGIPSSAGTGQARAGSPDTRRWYSLLPARRVVVRVQRGAGETWHANPWEDGPERIPSATGVSPWRRAPVAAGVP
jgi:hypothetical protein